MLAESMRSKSKEDATWSSRCSRVVRFLKQGSTVS